MQRLLLMFGFFGVVGFVFAPDATISVVVAVITFLGDFAGGVMPFVLNLWTYTPEVLWPIWGVLICGSVVFMMIGYFVASMIAGISRRD